MKIRARSFIKPFSAKVVFSAFFLMIAAIANIGFAFFLGGMVDAAINSDLSAFRHTALLSIAAMATELCFEMIGHAIRHNYSFQAAAEYKKALLSNMLSFEINSYSKYPEAYYLNVLSSEATTIKRHYFMQFPAIIHNAAQILLAVAALVFINWKFFCAVVVLFAVSGILPSLIGAVQGKKAVEASEKNEAFLSYLNSVLGAFELIKTFGIAEKITKTFSEYSFEGEKKNYSVDVVETARNVFSAASSFIIQMGAILTGVFLVFKGELSIGYLFVAIQVIGVIVSPITDLFQRISWVKSTAEIRQKHETILNWVETNRQKEGVEVGHINAITVSNLSFEYHDGFRLHDVNLKLSSGKKYAVIGKSGSGKSTLLKLLLGYFDGYSGSIKVNGTEIRDIDKNSYYEKLSVMNQNVVLFEDTLDNNIKLFRNVDDNVFKTIILKANLGELITRFHKEDELVSCDNISSISGGEKQRIALARCLLSDADAVFFDEATAALDPESARAIYDTVLEMKESMLVAVTHDWRDELLSRFDQVIYINDGTVKFIGNWEETKGYLRMD